MKINICLRCCRHNFKINCQLKYCISVFSRKGNESSIFDELVMDPDALGEMDDGIDITGELYHRIKMLTSAQVRSVCCEVILQIVRHCKVN